MNVEDVKFLFEYDRWANARMFEAVDALTDEQFAAVRETIAHIVGVEWIWFQRCNGVNPSATPAWMESPTRDTLRTQLHAIERDWQEYVASLGDDDLARIVNYVQLAGNTGSRKLVHLLQHVVNHSTYHRGQVATRIRQAGGVAVETDLLHFTGVEATNP
ncbi:MAG TPA: DinB family protein [Thermoanaerobaculia bacterium]|nr:DinB family protein [Thermoanaerobaculia bacterium]